MSVNTQILLKSRPVDAPTPDNFEIVTSPVPEPGDGEVLLRNFYLSLDPYMRGQMSDRKSYAEPVKIGSVMPGGTVGEVIESRDPMLSIGDIVLGNFNGWEEYSVARRDSLRKLDPELAPISTALGVLGMPGLTAYTGLTVIGKPGPGETVVVAAAAGPVGATVGQLAKIMGARAIGIAGGPEKVAYLESLGFDAALDHRSPTFADQLRAATPDGIDVYFENVGGHVWDAVLERLNTYARVPVCGLVAHYSQSELPPGPDRMSQLMMTVLSRSLTLRGFIQTEFEADYEAEFLGKAVPWVGDGTLQYREDVVEGLSSAPDAFIGLLQGRNFGKLLVKVS